jgi:hypothetical protein
MTGMTKLAEIKRFYGEIIFALQQEVETLRAKYEQRGLYLQDSEARVAHARQEALEEAAKVAGHLNGWGTTPHPELAAHLAKCIRALQPAAASALRPKGEADTGEVRGDESAWLIEMECTPGPNNYWTGPQRRRQWGSHESAVRFSRKEDAERVIAGITVDPTWPQSVKIKATEHMWCAALEDGETKP